MINPSLPNRNTTIFYHNIQSIQRVKIALNWKYINIMDSRNWAAGIELQFLQ